MQRLAGRVTSVVIFAGTSCNVPLCASRLIATGEIGCLQRENYVRDEKRPGKLEPSPQPIRGPIGADYRGQAIGPIIMAGSIAPSTPKCNY
jgi:hypothetical protein